MHCDCAHLMQFVRVPEPRSLVFAVAEPPALNRLFLRQGRGRWWLLRRRRRRRRWALANALAFDSFGWLDLRTATVAVRVDEWRGARIRIGPARLGLAIRGRVARAFHPGEVDLDHHAFVFVRQDVAMNDRRSGEVVCVLVTLGLQVWG